MQRLLSTYLFVSRKLAPELLGLIAGAGFQGLEIFCTRSHFEFCEVERVRRVEAMDELKRVIDVADDLPYARLILHMGGSRETADPRKRDAAFSSLEHLILHAHHAGVTICVENTLSEMGDPAYLRAFVDETRLSGLRFNFDIGHAHLAELPAEERLEKSFAPLRDLVSSAHIHDNHCEKDEHLPPYDGTIDWHAAIKLLKSAPKRNGHRQSERGTRD